MATGGQSHRHLQDVLPWNSSIKNNELSGSNATTILIQDTVETSGRFLLYLTPTAPTTLPHYILWLSCTASENERLIRQGLSKLGVADREKRITIRNVVQEMNDHILQNDNGDGGMSFDGEKFIRKIYQNILSWQKEKSQQLQGGQTASSSSDVPPCSFSILVHDVSALATLIGSRLAYSFCFQLQRHVQNLPYAISSTLIITCAGDDQLAKPGHVWVGAGGNNLSQSLSTAPTTAWECNLTELADWIVDVVPLTTGASRSVHGRMVITPSTSSLGDSIPSSASSLLVNYCLGENQVWATRIQQQTGNL